MTESTVFLVGAARSGTSLVYKSLCLHPRVAYISNYVRRAPAVAELAVANRLARRMPEHRRRAWFGDDSNAYVYGRGRRVVDRIFPAPVEGEPVFAHCGLAEFPFQPSRAADVRNRALRATFHRLRRASGADILVSKRIAHNWRIPQLLDAFPQARFVDVVRDGRAVALSLSKVDWWPTSPVFWLGITPAEWETKGGDPWELCGREWIEERAAIEEGLRGVPDDQVLRLGYEDLCREPRPHLGKILEFCGLAPTEAVWDDIARVRFGDPDGWRARFAPGPLAIVEAVQSEALARYGYAS